MSDETPLGDETPEPVAVKPATLSLRSVVPQSGWSLLWPAMLLLTVTGTVVAGAWYESQGAALGGSAYLRLLGLGEGRAAVWVASALLLLAAQLSLVIGWVRAHCLTDFDGRYRAWTRIGLAWLVLGAVIGTAAHLSLSQALLSRFEFKTIWQREILAWLLPLGVLVAGIAWVMDGELKTSRTARFLMWLGLLVVIGGTVLVVEPAQVQPAAGLLAILKISALLAGPTLLVLSLLAFLRHVVHVSPEPAPRRRWRRKQGRESDALDGEESDAEEEDAEEEVEEEAETAGEYDDYDDEEVEEIVEEEEYTYSAYADSNPDSPTDLDEHDYRVDEADQSAAFPDKASLKGLSKRERRQLRKQWREEQRNSQ